MPCATLSRRRVYPAACSCCCRRAHGNRDSALATAIHHGQGVQDICDRDSRRCSVVNLARDLKTTPPASPGPMPHRTPACTRGNSAAAATSAAAERTQTISRHDPKQPFCSDAFLLDANRIHSLENSVSLRNVDAAA